MFRMCIAMLCSLTVWSGAALAEGPYKMWRLEKNATDSETTLCVRLVEQQVGLDELLAELKNPDKYTRISAINAVVHPITWPEEDRGALVLAIGERLADDDQSVVYWASRVLYYIGPDAVAVLPELIKTAEEETGVTRTNAIDAIANIGPLAEPAVPVLQRLLRVEERFLPMHVCNALASIGPKAVPALAEALDSSDEIRIEAVHSLAMMGTDAKPAIADLRKLLASDSPLLKRHAELAIEKIGRPREEYPPWWVYGTFQRHAEAENAESYETLP